jgi:hypothetical protein
MVLIKKQMNKRGMFFMLLAILLISILLLSYTFYSQFRERKIIQKRVETMNNFVFAVEEDLERRLFIASFRIIFLFESEIIESGDPISNFDVRFDEAFYNGTFNGDFQNLMFGATFYDTESVLKEKASKIGANLSFTNPSVVVSQDDPWNVKFVLTMDFVANDITDLVKWNKTLTVESFVPIEGFGDPLYVINTNSLVFSNITKSPYSVFVSGDDVSNLLSHTEGSFYIANPDAPSFLDRLKGVNVGNVNGIESLVDLGELASLGIGVQEKSVVDHIYFSGNNPASCNVLPSGMPYWFKLDDVHMDTYDLTSCAL